MDTNHTLTNTEFESRDDEQNLGALETVIGSFLDVAGE
jgi:hypothetical protein